MINNRTFIAFTHHLRAIGRAISPPLCWLVAATILCTTVIAVPQLINYQGRLADQTGDPLPDGDYAFEFTIYSDSVGGSPEWSENATIPTVSGLFSHLLGSVQILTPSLFESKSNLYLEVVANGELITPRTRLASSPFAMAAGALRVADSTGTTAILTDGDGHRLLIHNSIGVPTVTVTGLDGDSSLMLPDSAINADEILNEPGVASSFDFDQRVLSTIEMQDLVKVTIETPSFGYIVLHGKCYVLLSGTTGPNTADVQIDFEEAGSSLFPYFSRAGLGGYVNNETSYFPVYVTRSYWANQGTYTFRMEGKANYPTPADARTWDHILTAVFYPTSYRGVESLSPVPIDHPAAVPVIINNPEYPERNGTYYQIDLREFENDPERTGNTPK